MPFPSQHPYTSHISQFSVFPDTRKDFNTPLYHQVDISESYEPTSEEEDGSIQEEKFKETAIQTDLSCLKFEHSLQPATQPKAPSYIIREKAFSNGVRIEKEIAPSDQTKSKPIPTNVTSFALRPGVYRWDISRRQSLGHQVSNIVIAKCNVLINPHIAFYDISCSDNNVLSKEPLSQCSISFA